MGRQNVPNHIISHCGYTIYRRSDNKRFSTLSIECIYEFHVHFRINGNYFLEIYDWSLLRRKKAYLTFRRRNIFFNFSRPCI